MLEPVRVMDIELSQRPEDVEGLGGYAALQALVRLHGRPLGTVTLPVQGGRCQATELVRTILDQHGLTIIHHLVRHKLEGPLEPGELCVEDLASLSPAVQRGPWPSVTAVVCTRDRTDNLALCLDALTNLTYSNLDLLVVDNAPTDDATKELVCARFPEVRYVCEPRPGLNWARNRAIVEAQGEIIAFTDDDAVADPGWVSALARLFAENPEVTAVTGLVVPYELEATAQVLFEVYGGFGRGFRRRWYCLERENHRGETWHIGAGAFGTGANMAFRRHLFEQIGGFDPALDVGTVTNGGGDLEMFFRLLREGHVLVYEPSAVVRHRHRRDYPHLKTQLTNHGTGLYSYLVRSALAYPGERSAIARLGIKWLWWWNVRRLLKSLVRPGSFPRELILAELKGSFVGLARYQRARRRAQEIAEKFGPVRDMAEHKESMLWPGPEKELAAPVPQQATGRRAGKRIWPTKGLAARENPVAVRTLDLSRPLCALTDVSDYSGVRVYVSWGGQLLGRVDIANCRHPIGVARLRDAIVDNLTAKLLEPGYDLKTEAGRDKALAALSECYMPPESTAAGREPAALPSNVPVSVVVATRDRPEDLGDCLRGLRAQVTSRPVEIVIVDNHPASGLTPPVVAEFPGVILVSEPRKGLSYARNKGIVASSGDIVIAVDDDVTIPDHWLERLVAPFARSDVMAVTGNVLPFELETEAQRLFEEYGGLGRGFEPFVADRDWFESFRFRAVPTWQLGATANAAFRATIFRHPEIGLMDEALGVGTPTGCSEDTYLFYRILKAGYTISYQPEAFVWHKHRREMRALRRQLYGYSKGHVAYHLTTLLRDHDLRAMRRLALGLPRAHLWRIRQRLRGRSVYPLSLIIIEMLGNLAGPLALWRSRWRVKCQGRSDPYIPVSKRFVASQSILR